MHGAVNQPLTHSRRSIGRYGEPSWQGKRMKVCDPIAGALSGRSQVRKPCRTQKGAGSEDRLLTYLRDRYASCVCPVVLGIDHSPYGYMVQAEGEVLRIP